VGAEDGVLDGPVVGRTLGLRVGGEDGVVVGLLEGAWVGLVDGRLLGNCGVTSDLMRWDWHVHLGGIMARDHSAGWEVNPDAPMGQRMQLLRSGSIKYLGG
jgi:hypothetical protein